MRYSRLRVWIIFLAIVLSVFFMVKYAAEGPGIFRSDQPVTDSLITATYPDLYQAISKRDANKLRPFLSHKSEEVRRQAWRALANTPTDSLSAYIALAQKQNSDVAWFAISQHACTNEQLRDLEALWDENPDYRSGIARVFGQQGDEQSLNFLLDHLNSNNHGEEFSFGLALGRLAGRFEISGDAQIAIIQQAFSGNDEQNTRAYLYGWYRGSEYKLTAVAQDTLMNHWRTFGVGTNLDVDQYVNKLMPERTTHRMVVYYNGEQRLDDDIQLAVELANSLGHIQLNEDNALAARILLMNSNPHVQVQVLQSLSGRIEKGQDLYNHIRNVMIPDSNLANTVWLQALTGISTVDSDVVKKYRGRLEQIPEENPYLLPEVLTIFEQVSAPKDYLQRIGQIVDQEKPLQTMYALQSLDKYWQELTDEQKTSSSIDKVRGFVFKALSLRDRGTAYMAQPLLEDGDLFSGDDFGQINNSLTSFSLPGDIEVYQVFGALYKTRFEQQAKAVIDSLAALDYAPLNRSLADAGWDVNIPGKTDTDFRLPNWQRLWKLGRHPVWRIRTAKGDIQIRMNTLSAPATVSAIDSLSRAGVYDGIPFHRVVPNFVIQGGDIERKDGFGGPDFIIPTEASEQGFVRGAVGIASAGRDTEGSQYFIMHQWKPHLNGHYTRFGIVVDGMDVVDKIVVGDNVRTTTWY